MKGAMEGFYIGESGIYARLFRPDGPEKCPLVVLFHGIPGNETNLDIAYALRDEGYAVLAPNYNGCWGSHGDYRIQNIPNNVKTVLDYACSNEFTAKWGIDAERIGVFGHSLGGWATLISPKISKKIKGIVATAPVIEFENLKLSPETLAEEFVIPLRGVTAQQIVEGWKWADGEWSPLKTVKELDGRYFVLISATEDEIMYNESSLTLYNEAKKASDKAEFWLLHSDHAFISERERFRRLVVERIKKYL